jgi:hypothetical protein
MLTPRWLYLYRSQRLGLFIGFSCYSQKVYFWEEKEWVVPYRSEDWMEFMKDTQLTTIFIEVEQL